MELRLDGAPSHTVGIEGGRALRLCRAGGEGREGHRLCQRCGRGAGWLQVRRQRVGGGGGVGDGGSDGGAVGVVVGRRGGGQLGGPEGGGLVGQDVLLGLGGDVGGLLGEGGGDGRTAEVPGRKGGRVREKKTKIRLSFGRCN